MAAQEITKVQELLYTTRVENVMVPQVIVTGPDVTVGEARQLMKDKGVSGMPVVQDCAVVGMLSIAEVVAALEDGRLEAPVADYMTREVKSVFGDMYVVELVGGLGGRGFGRFPVLDRDGKLVGIVTKASVMQSLLHEMDVRFKKKEQEKLPSYRASHIFEDIASDDTRVRLRYVVDDKDFENAGKASSQIKRALQRLGVLPSVVRRVAVAVYEAEMNLVIHTDVGGEVTVEVWKDRLTISAVDHGPGIADVREVLKPGYSTAPEWIRAMGFGAGMGLANIKRCADLMKLTSEPGVGTRLDIYFLVRDTPMEAEAVSGKKS